MRFQKGIGCPYPRRPRGPGRGQYRMSRAAYHARLRNLAHVNRKHTYEQTRRDELEIALATHRGENYRAMAKRLGLAHAYCWRVARKYCAGLIPMLPRDEQELLALRDSLAPAPPNRPSSPGTRPAGVLDGHGWNCKCAACRATAAIDAALREVRESKVQDHISIPSSFFPERFIPWVNQNGTANTLPVLPVKGVLR